ncbi:MAG TPA: ferredoxin [Miltoncostaeaceae bacterium]|nr:ferredoxin [Miltoncostaeaceae bacterium]
MAEITIDGVRYRLWVDRELCMGNRVCEGRLPQVFAVDDETNLSTAVEGALDPALAAAVRESVTDCPQDAIRLEPVD